MLSEHFISLVQLQALAHNFHIRTLNKDFVIHGYLGDLYEALSDKIDIIGEQMIILEEDVPEVSECFCDIQANKNDTAEDMVKNIYELFEFEKDILVILSENDMDEGTRNLIADEILFFGKECAKLKSLLG